MRLEAARFPSGYNGGLAAWAGEPGWSARDGLLKDMGVGRVPGTDGVLVPGAFAVGWGEGSEGLGWAGGTGFFIVSAVGLISSALAWFNCTENAGLACCL